MPESRYRTPLRVFLTLVLVVSLIGLAVVYGLYISPLVHSMAQSKAQPSTSSIWVPDNMVAFALPADLSLPEHPGSFAAYRKAPGTWVQFEAGQPHRFLFVGTDPATVLWEGGSAVPCQTPGGVLVQIPLSITARIQNHAQYLQRVGLSSPGTPGTLAAIQHARPLESFLEKEGRGRIADRLCAMVSKEKLAWLNPNREIFLDGVRLVVPTLFRPEGIDITFVGSPGKFGFDQPIQAAANQHYIEDMCGELGCNPQKPLPLVLLGTFASFFGLSFLGF